MTNELKQIIEDYINEYSNIIAEAFDNDCEDTIYEVMDVYYHVDNIICDALNNRLPEFINNPSEDTVVKQKEEIEESLSPLMKIVEDCKTKYDY